MTQEDKEIFLKDLSSRLPYNVKVNFQDMENPYGLETPAVLTPSILREFWCKAEDIRPYLRPMSSMTKDEEEELRLLKNQLVKCDENNDEKFYGIISEIHKLYLLNHIDFMGLIPKGLAIEVTEENNPYKE